MTDIKIETGTEVPHPMMRPSPYDQKAAFDRFLNLATQIASEVPEDKRDGTTVQQFSDSIISDFIANALSVVIYSEDAETLDAVLAKAMHQVGERVERERAMARMTPAMEA